MPHALLTSASAAARLDRAAAWLRRRRGSDRVLILAASADAAGELARAVVARRRAAFGWHRLTLGRLAAALATPALTAFGLVPVGAVALQALCARVIDGLAKRGELGRFSPVADRPGLPRAIARTLLEVRLAGFESDALEPVGLDRIHDAFEVELDRARLADRAIVLRLAAERARDPDLKHPLLGLPTLLLDVRVACELERDLVEAVADRSPDALATVPAGDNRSLRHLSAALRSPPRRVAWTGVSAAADAGGAGGGASDVEAPEPADDERAAPGSALARLQEHLFDTGPEGDDGPPPGFGDDVILLSAPGESRECVEIARLALKQAACGVPFDRMAVLLRAPEPYRVHIEEALRRAGIPAYLAEGSLQPDPAGRALLALLSCACENLSATRFAEYLSLGQVPDTDRAAEAPPASEADRWVPPDEDLLPEILLRDPAGLEDQGGGPVGERTAGEPDDAWERAAAEPADAAAGASADAADADTARAPRRWEQILIQAAVIAGLDRWKRRLDRYEQELRLDLDHATEERDIARVTRTLRDLDALRRFALPLLGSLPGAGEVALWGEWLDRLSALATRALRRPDRVLAVLAELAPMADVGPVDLSEVRLVLAGRLTEMVVPPEGRREARLFVAPIEAARGRVFDVVFVPGLAEKIFPQKVSEDPILRDALRELVSDGAAGRARLDTSDERVAEERLALRLAVGAARLKLVVSYPRVDMDQSRPRVPSFYGLELLRAAEGRLPGFGELASRAEQGGAARIGWPAPARPQDAIDAAEHDLALLETLFHLPEDQTIGTARYLLGVNPHLARALRFRARRWIPAWTSADGLFKPIAEARAALDAHAFSRRSFSPTALQHFAACPYKFFLYAVHKLGPRRVPAAIEEMDPLQRGSLVHDVLFEVLVALRDAGKLPVTPATLEEARDELDRVLDRVAARYADELAPAIDRVWQDGIASVRADLREWLRRAAGDRDWEPIQFELSFGLPRRRARDPESPDDPVRLDCGVQLRGSIDLVERSAWGAVRATDYKTGRVRSQTDSIVGGGQMLQPVLYALALEKLMPPGTHVESGRLYYCTSAGGFTELPIYLDQRARDAAAEVTSIIGDALDKAALPAIPAEGACAHCDYRPVCGPYEELRAGRVKRQDLEQRRRLDRLRRLA